MIKLHTNHGVITLELDAEKAPKTVANFLAYVEAGHYDNTVFHRVIDGFMIQGGGFEPGMKQKPMRGADRERSRQRPEERARHRRHGAHLRPALGHRPVLHQRRRQRLPRLSRRRPANGWGYCVFGKVVEGMDVVDKIKGVKTGSKGFHQDVPVEDVIIERAEVAEIVLDRFSSPTCTCRPGTAGDDRAVPCAFSPGRARQAEALYILGDLFEYWVGDDDLDDPFNARICRPCATRRDAGTQIYLHARQPRLPRSAQQFAARDRRDACCPIRLSSTSTARRRCARTATRCAPTTPTYQAFRAQVARPGLARRLAGPAARRAPAMLERCCARSSEAAQAATKTYASWTSTRPAVADFLREHGYATFIHGHTHRPATARPSSSTASACERWVLADWHDRGNACSAMRRAAAAAR